MNQLTTYSGIIWYHLIYKSNHSLKVPGDQPDPYQDVRCPLDANVKECRGRSSLPGCAMPLRRKRKGVQRTQSFAGVRGVPAHFPHPATGGGKKKTE
jgi:hypothetical protein